MKRSGCRAMISRLWAARARIAWCMVGTAVYQVGLASSIQPKNLSALKPGVQNTLPPAQSEDSTEPMRPWMWNNGMTLRQRSAGVRLRMSRMWPAEAQTLRCDSGTILGREVVPEVCSTSATSSGPANPPAAAVGDCFDRNQIENPGGVAACAHHLDHRNL